MLSGEGLLLLMDVWIEVPAISAIIVPAIDKTTTLLVFGYMAQVVTIATGHRGGKNQVSNAAVARHPFWFHLVPVCRAQGANQSASLLS